LKQRRFRRSSNVNNLKSVRLFLQKVEQLREAPCVECCGEAFAETVAAEGRAAEDDPRPHGARRVEELRVVARGSCERAARGR